MTDLAGGAESQKLAAEAPLLRTVTLLTKPAQITDGYYRICASKDVNENAEIPIRIIDL